MRHDGYAEYKNMKSNLSDQGREFVRAVDMDSCDWYSFEDAGMDTLWSLCEVLRGYESEEWGNTGGRYNHMGGFITDEGWKAIEEGDVDSEHLTDFSDPAMLIAMVEWANENGVEAMVEVADALRDSVRRVY